MKTPRSNKCKCPVDYIELCPQLETELATARAELALLSQPEAIRHEMLKEALAEVEAKDELLREVYDTIRPYNSHVSPMWKMQPEIKQLRDKIKASEV